MQIALAGVSARHPAAKADAQAALRGLSVSIASGEQVAVIGPSGSGKTTFLQVLACALRPSAGVLRLGVGAGAFAASSAAVGAATQAVLQDPWALTVRQLQALRGQLFLAPQVPPLPPRQRVVTTVLAGRLPQQSLLQSLRSLLYPADMALAHAALARFDVADKLFERVDRLSGGERQRVGLARGLVADASLFLVDEPLSALDPSRAEQAIASLTQAAREKSATLVASLHHVQIALAHFPRIIGLQAGELAFDLPANEVSPERLHQLYASKLDELTGPAPADDLPLPAGTAAAVMHCR